MGIKYLWDTNIAIYYLQQQLPPVAEKFIDDLLVNSQPCISAITEIELLCWKTTNKEELDILHNFIKDSFVIELEQPIKLKTADIRKQFKIKLPNAIIVATALVYGLILITRTISDFKSILELQVIDPYNV